MKLLNKSIFFGITLILTSFSAMADIKAVATIKPIHSLLASVMEGVGTPSLIVEGSNSPHNFTLKPSHATMLEEADIIFWVGEDLELFLEKPLESLAKDAKKISLLELPSIQKLKFRESNIHDEHHGHEDEHEGHDDEHHGHEDEHEEDDKNHNEHMHGEFDAHVWLDPMNAQAIVLEMAHELSKIDSTNKDIYELNAQKLTSSLDALMERANQIIPEKPSFIVFHDAYQYFENRFGIRSEGALTLNPDVLPGAKQIAEIQELIEHENVKCIFSEPQYNPKIIEVLAEDMNVSTGIIDPLGASIDKGPSMYNSLILDIANSLEDCS